MNMLREDPAVIFYKKAKAWEGAVRVNDDKRTGKEAALNHNNLVGVLANFRKVNFQVG